jgi:hypothetical protein
MSWITELWEPKYLNWTEYKAKIENLERKNWEEDVKKHSKENMNITS